MLLAGCASAPSGAAGRLMAVLDADGDARLSAAEFADVAHPSASFAAADLDHDGYVDVPELDALLRAQGPLLPDHAGRLDLPEPAGLTLAGIDQDHDGAISAAEWAGEGFTTADADRDGRVDAGELAAWLGSVKAEKR